jgi:hypothetical protein
MVGWKGRSRVEVSCQLLKLWPRPISPYRRFLCHLTTPRKAAQSLRSNQALHQQRVYHILYYKAIDYRIRGEEQEREHI